jgi:hypothetical protein
MDEGVMDREMKRASHPLGEADLLEALTAIVLLGLFSQ